jgi:SAM-dependent methyltransferase
VPPPGVPCYRDGVPEPLADVLARSRAQWTAASTTWDREGDVIAASTRAVTATLLAAAAPAPGQRVLDVAGGTGDPTLDVARAVGPRGRVVCADLTPAMLAGARRRTAEAGLRIDAVATCAEALPFRRHAFDAVVSRFGVMLFADPAAAVRDMVRVARPGAVVAAAVWGTPERNPYFSVPMAALGRHVALPPPDPDAPSVFRLAAPGALGDLLRRAGAADVVETRHPFEMTMALALDEFWPFLLRVAAPMRATVEAQPPAVQAAVARAVHDDMARFHTGGMLRVPAEAVLAHGHAHQTAAPSGPVRSPTGT